MIKFEKPEYKVKEYVESDNYGKFEIEPLERGFGTTLGNALRRVMLSSLPGDAITSVKISGVQHEFQKIDGVIEDVTAIVLNLKSIVIKNHSEDYSYILRIHADSAGEVIAGDIDAMLEVAFCYLYGTDVKKNEAKAAKWYHRAAEHGNAKAQVELGDCYRCGRGVKKNDEEAAKWYRQAAEQGSDKDADRVGQPGPDQRPVQQVGQPGDDPGYAE